MIETSKSSGKYILGVIAVVIGSALAAIIAGFVVSDGSIGGGLGLINSQY